MGKYDIFACLGIRKKLDTRPLLIMQFLALGYLETRFAKQRP